MLSQGLKQILQGQVNIFEGIFLLKFSKTSFKSITSFLRYKSWRSALKINSLPLIGISQLFWYLVRSDSKLSLTT